jgi:hypothetical protein
MEKELNDAKGLMDWLDDVWPGAALPGALFSAGRNRTTASTKIRVAGTTTELKSIIIIVIVLTTHYNLLYIIPRTNLPRSLHRPTTDAMRDSTRSFRVVVVVVNKSVTLQVRHAAACCIVVLMHSRCNDLLDQSCAPTIDRITSTVHVVFRNL